MHENPWRKTWTQLYDQKNNDEKPDEATCSSHESPSRPLREILQVPGELSLLDLEASEKQVTNSWLRTRGPQLREGEAGE